VIKPDPRIYAITLRRMGNPDPAEVLFVDDRLSNIHAADTLGFRTHHFDGAPGLETKLKAEGLL